MRVALLSKTYLFEGAQRQLEVLAALPDVDLTLITPRGWRSKDGHDLTFVPRYTTGYGVRPVDLLLGGRYHLFLYRGLARVLHEVQPDILHIDEEPYNPAAAHAQLVASRLRIPTVQVTLQNIYRRTPLPWSWIERYNFRQADHIIAANAEAEMVLRRKGYRGQSSVRYIYGVDPDIYIPQLRAPRQDDHIMVGYVGRQLFDKGLGVLLDALAHLPERYRARLIGIGPDREELQKRAAALGLTDRVEFASGVPTSEIPRVMSEFDLFVLPSLTRPNWKEQFGRVLIEAMSCGVPVIGSDSGEIPHVVADAGIIAPEGDAAALADAIARLGEHPDLRAEYAQRARAHVLANHTLEQVARRFVSLYGEMLGTRAGLAARGSSRAASADPPA